MAIQTGSSLGFVIAGAGPVDAVWPLGHAVSPAALGAMVVDAYGAAPAIEETPQAPRVPAIFSAEVARLRGERASQPQSDSRAEHGDVQPSAGGSARHAIRAKGPDDGPSSTSEDGVAKHAQGPSAVFALLPELTALRDTAGREEGFLDALGAAHREANLSSPRATAAGDEIGELEYVVKLRNALIGAGVELPVAELDLEQIAETEELLHLQKTRIRFDDKAAEKGIYLDAVLARLVQLGIDVSAFSKPPRTLTNWKISWAVTASHSFKENFENCALGIIFDLLREKMIAAAAGDPASFALASREYRSALREYGHEGLEYLGGLYYIDQETEALTKAILEPSLGRSARRALVSVPLAFLQGEDEVQEPDVSALEREYGDLLGEESAGIMAKGMVMAIASDREDDQSRMLQAMMTQAGRFFGMSKDLRRSAYECLYEGDGLDDGPKKDAKEAAALVLKALDAIRDHEAMSPAAIAARWLVLTVAPLCSRSAAQSFKKKSRELAEGIHRAALALIKRGDPTPDVQSEMERLADAYGWLSLWFEGKKEEALLKRMRRSKNTLERAFAERALLALTKLFG